MLVNVRWLALTMLQETPARFENVIDYDGRTFLQVVGDKWQRKKYNNHTVQRTDWKEASLYPGM